MKTIVSQLFKTTIILTVFFSVFTSCSKDDDTTATETPLVSLPPASITSYIGVLTYQGTDGLVVVNSENASATISGDSSNYTITFSDDVPPLSGLRFLQSEGTYVSISNNNSVEGIVVSDGGLVVSVTREGNIWNFTNQ